jgi:hypothetical protein
MRYLASGSCKPLLSSPRCSRGSSLICTWRRTNTRTRPAFPGSNSIRHTGLRGGQARHLLMKQMSKLGFFIKKMTAPAPETGGYGDQTTPGTKLRACNNNALLTMYRRDMQKHPSACSRVTNRLAHTWEVFCRQQVTLKTGRFQYNMQCVAHRVPRTSST